MSDRRFLIGLALLAILTVAGITTLCSWPLKNHSKAGIAANWETPKPLWEVRKPLKSDENFLRDNKQGKIISIALVKEDGIYYHHYVVAGVTEKYQRVVYLVPITRYEEDAYPQLGDVGDIVDVTSENKGQGLTLKKVWPQNKGK